MTDFDEIGRYEREIYRALLACPASTADELIEQLAASAEADPTAAHGSGPTDATVDTGDSVRKAVGRLVDAGLLRVDPDDRLTAVSPMLAEATVLGAEDLELGARRAALEQRRDALRQLIPAWNSALAEVVHESSVDVITGQSAIANTLMHYAETCDHELMSVAPGRMAASRIDSRTRVANMYSLRRGIVTRAIYQHIALRDRATRSYLNEIAQQGARIRFAPSVPGRLLVVDRKVVLLPVPSEDKRSSGLAVVREPTVLAWIVATFEQLWAEAATLEDALDTDHDDTELDQTRAAILRLMAEGEKDEAISRRLAISVRTCRRHIADYMVQVGASSRFQAGVIAARAGHTEAATAGEAPTFD